MIGNRDIYLDRTKVNTFSLQLNHCGVQECTPGYSYSFDANSYHLIHFVLGGSGFLEINHRLINIHAGQAFYIPPGLRQDIVRHWKRHGHTGGLDSTRILRIPLSHFYLRIKT